MNNDILKKLRQFYLQDAVPSVIEELKVRLNQGSTCHIPKVVFIKLQVILESFFYVK